MWVIASDFFFLESVGMNENVTHGHPRQVKNEKKNYDFFSSIMW
jgi:hypothetical protein